jgi:HlyD family secretion protein
MIRKYVLPFVALAMLLFAVYHVVRSQQPRQQAEPPDAPARRPFAGAVAGAGVVEPQTGNIAVAAPAPGVAAEVYVKAGEQVEAGAPLFRLNDRTQRAELRLREEGRAVAEAQLARLENAPRPEELPLSAARVREAEAHLADAESQYKHGQARFGQRLLGEEELDHRRLVLQVARERLARAQAADRLLRAGAWSPDRAVTRAELARAKAQVDLVKTELDRLTVRAPVAGVVLRVNVHTGEAVGVPQAAVPVILGNLRPLHLRVDIDENDIPRYLPGAPARAALRGDPGREFALRFVSVEPYVVPKRSLTGDVTERTDTRVLQVVYAFDPGDRPVYVGQQMDVFIEARAK